MSRETFMNVIFSGQPFIPYALKTSAYYIHSVMHSLVQAPIHEYNGLGILFGILYQDHMHL